MKKYICPDCGGEAQQVAKYLQYWAPEKQEWKNDTDPFEVYACCADCDWEGDKSQLITVNI